MDGKLKIKMQFFSDEEKQNITNLLENIVFPQEPMNLFFIKMNDAGEKERLAVRSATNDNQLVILFSNNNDVAAFAWKANVASYVDMADSMIETNIQNGIRRANVMMHDIDNHKLVFNGQNQVNVIDATKILFVVAAGNYCDIHLQDGNVVTVTKQLGKMCDMLSPYFNMKRIGKKVIVNINKIVSLKGNIVTFVGNGKLEFSESSRCIAQLRKFLLWK